MISQTKTHEKGTIQMINVTSKEFQAIVNDYYSGKLNLTMSEIMDRYIIVLETPPTHNNPEINKLIERFCDESERRDGRTLYSGHAMNYLGFGRHLPDGFKEMHEAANGYREAHFSMADLVSVSTCEGDVTINIFDDINAYNAHYEHAKKFYAEY